MSNNHASKSRPVLFALVGAALTLSTAAALADGDAPRRAVSYADLNLAVDADAAKLYARIERAARAVCNAPSGGDLRLRLAARQCAKRAVADAVADVDSARLTAVHQADERYALVRAAAE